MEQLQFKNLVEWFNSYVAGMYGKDDYINANLKLKEEHSKRTAAEMRYLGEMLNMKQEDRYLAEAIGLLHDAGRFEQFVAYQTYVDSKSTNHGRLGIKVLREGFVLEGLDQTEMSIIETAVEYHGVKDLPVGLGGKRLQFTRMVRDADKMDIFVVSIENYRQFAANPEKYQLEVEFPAKGGCSPEVISAVMKGERVDYRLLKSMDDFRLLQLGWVFDINYTPALMRIRERRQLEEIGQMLPNTVEVQTAVRRVLSYVEERLSKE